MYGYPGEPPRLDGLWVDLDLKGTIASGLVQVESRSDQSIKAQPGFSGSPVWEGGVAVGLVTGTALADEPYRDAYLVPALTVAKAWGEKFRYLLVPANPYRGLEPFTEEDHEVFFGRGQNVTDLVRLVRAQPVVTVVGASGVGKSSLVLAGLIPALEGDKTWTKVILRPGPSAWPRLADALVRADRGTTEVVAQDESERQVERLHRQGLEPLARHLLSQDRRLLVVVDQLEELLAPGNVLDEELLRVLVPPPGTESAARVVLTLRADFLGALLGLPEIGPAPVAGDVPPVAPYPPPASRGCGASCREGRSSLRGGVSGRDRA